MGAALATRIDFHQVRANVDLIDVVERYVPTRKAGPERQFPCPFHDDSSPSGTIYTGRDGVQRFKCFGCGANGDVIDFIMRAEQVNHARAVDILAGESFTARPRPAPAPIAPLWRALLPVPLRAPPMDPHQLYNPKSGRTLRLEPVRVDEYRDGAGHLLGYVLRDNLRDGSKWTPTVTYAEGPDGARCWALVSFPDPRPLQGLDALARRPNDRVLIVSGEKCRAAAAATLSDFVAVTWPGGDNAVRKVDWRPLHGRDCIFWPDADESGIAAMTTAAELAKPSRRRVLDVGELAATFGKGADIADLVATGWGEELISAWGGLHGC
jgi:hypothetical protein